MEWKQNRSVNTISYVLHTRHPAKYIIRTQNNEKSFPCLSHLCFFLLILLCDITFFSFLFLCQQQWHCSLSLALIARFYCTYTLLDIYFIVCYYYYIVTFVAVMNTKSFFFLYSFILPFFIVTVICLIYFITLFNDINI